MIFGTGVFVIGGGVCKKNICQIGLIELLIPAYLQNLPRLRMTKMSSVKSILNTQGFDGNFSCSSAKSSFFFFFHDMIKPLQPCYTT